MIHAVRVQELVIALLLERGNGALAKTLAINESALKHALVL
jgi:hypothetical protein